MSVTIVIPADYLAVLEAMLRPDPAPTEGLDSPAAALCRRLPNLGLDRSRNILHDLTALGLTHVCYLEGMVNAEETRDLSRYLTDEGWATLGFRPVHGTH